MVNNNFTGAFIQRITDKYTFDNKREFNFFFFIEVLYFFNVSNI